MLQISKKDQIYQMNKNNSPVATAQSGSVIEFETADCFNDQIKCEKTGIAGLNWEEINPATGPVYIEGAQVGDVLKVKIKDIKIQSPGVMAAVVGAGLLGDEVAESEVRVMEIADGVVHFNENIKIPVNPMVGVIGVAPRGDGISCGTPDAHGGNMDTKKIVAGTTLYFPVFTDGAMLAMGDLHAVMGDGEIMVSGVEVSGRVIVEVEVIKNDPLTQPILETDSHFYTIASHEDLLSAVKMATKEMQQLVMKQLNLSFNEAGMLLSAIGDAEISQVVDPLLTARFGLTKDILPDIF